MTYERDAEMLAAALAVTPLAAQTSSKAPGRVGPMGAFPLFLSKGKGPYVWGADWREPRRYIDFFNGNCAVTLGHANERVNERVTQALGEGALLSLPTYREATVAYRLAELIPCAEQIRFVKTGSEACAGAARIARMATGRDVIAVVRGQYHGWHDWHCVTKPSHPGVPDFMGQGVRLFEYNDLASLRAVLDSDVAAVMLEPTLTVEPTPGWLADVKNLAYANGSLLIFDEMITGARWHIGGAQQIYGVTPDLATFGKAYANGLPLAFIAGGADLMKHAWVVSGTFGGESLGLAACEAVLDIHRKPEHLPPPVARMHAVGKLLKSTVNGYCEAVSVPAALVGPDVRPVWDWSRIPADERPLVVSLMQQELAAHGVLVHPSGWNTSAAHHPDALEHALLGILEAVLKLKGYLARDPDDRPACLHGELIQDGAVRTP